MKHGLNLSISIVVYRPDFEVLARALAALHEAVMTAARERSLQTVLYVVDNSCDPARVPGVDSVVRSGFPDSDAATAELIVSPRNCGYGQGNNLAIERAASDYHLVMNPDVYPDREAIGQAIGCMEGDQTVGLLVPDVHGEDGARHYLCKHDPYLLMMLIRGFGPSWVLRLLRRRLDRFEMRDHDYGQAIDGIEYPTGCFMFFRSSSLKRLGGFDPGFFMYFEDADIGRRMRQIASVRYAPRVRVVHRWARGFHNSWRLRGAGIKSGFRYFSKWGGVFSLGP
jgi:GT2 family glycosyltransferase